MGTTLLNNIIITPLKRINTEGGDVFKVLMKNEPSFSEFGEAYFSQVHSGAIKAWKFHEKMTLNLIVPVGKVRFVFYEDIKGKGYIREEEIGDHNYARLTVPPGIWFGFKGIDTQTSLILNIANILHDPNEAKRCSINDIKYNW
jgi:dTDP-4-dehydrorhamnose 3,5-epimerase